jgi:hypothetical protein
VRRSIAFLVLLVLAAGVAAFLIPTPTEASGGPCVLCPPRECGPCEMYTGDTCYTCGTCKRIPRCKP